MRSQLALDTMNGTPIDYDAQVQDAYAALQAARAGKRPAATATPADTPASADTVPPPREPALKKRKGLDSAPVLPRKLFRMPSNLVPQERALPKMARVTLRPSVELGPDG